MEYYKDRPERPQAKDPPSFTAPLKSDNAGFAQAQHPTVSTETLQLVIREEVTEANRFFGRPVISRVGYDLAIFRQGTIAGWIAANSVTTLNELGKAYRSRVKNGDVVYAIKNGQWHLEISDTLRTKDGRSRDYTLDLTLSIIDARQFIEQYVQYSNQHTDPVEMVSRAIKGFLRQTMGLIDHDLMSDRDLINAALEALRYENNSAFGLVVNRADVLRFDIDPHIKKLREIDQRIEKGSLEAKGEGTIGKIKAQNDADVKIIAKKADVEVNRLERDAQREQSWKDATFEAELERHKLHQIIDNLAYHNQIEEAKLAKEVRAAEHEGRLVRIRANNQASVQVTEIRNELIKDLSRMKEEYLRSIREAVEDDQQRIGAALADSGLLELLAALERLSGSSATAHRSLPSIAQTSAETFPDTGAPGKPSGEWPSPTTGPLPGILKQDVAEDPILLIADLGLKLILTSLGEEQSPLTGLGQHTAFLICGVITHSPVEQARLQVGDILVEMNALPLATLEDLSRAVSSARPGQELSFVALRDRALISGTIKLPH